MGVLQFPARYSTGKRVRLRLSRRLRRDDPTQIMSFTAGTRFGHYSIVRAIGAGGMGEVYLVEDERLRRRVALKVLPSHLAMDETSRKRLLREARTAATLQHP